MWRVVSATSRPLYPWKKPGTLCIGGSVDPRSGLDGCGKSRPQSVQLVEKLVLKENGNVGVCPMLLQHSELNLLDCLSQGLGNKISASYTFSFRRCNVQCVMQHIRLSRVKSGCCIATEISATLICAQEGIT
jgi:hypothetical protein